MKYIKATNFASFVEWDAIGCGFMHLQLCSNCITTTTTNSSCMCMGTCEMRQHKESGGNIELVSTRGAQKAELKAV